MNRITKRTGGMVLTGAIAASLLTVMPLLTPQPAEAAYATGGSGQYRDAIDWLTWDVPIFTEIEDGQALSSERTIGGQTLRTECVLSYQSGVALAYKPGNWVGDSLDDLYNVGGTGTDNQLVNAIITGPEGGGDNSETSFDLECSASLNGTPVELGGIVVADAEETTNEASRYEWVEVAPNNSGATWRLLEQRYSDCPTNTGFRFTNNAGRVRFDVDGPSCRTNDYWPGNNYVAYLEGADGVSVTSHSAAAVAFGVVLNLDTGDAPESYGQPWSVFTQPWEGGEIPEGTSFATELPLASMSDDVTPRLGDRVTPDTLPLHSDDAQADEGDDSVDLSEVINVKRGSTFSVDVACVGPGLVSGWVDWNNNGVFDTNEMSDTQECVDGSTTLTWSVPADAVSSTTFARLRIDTNENALTPTGFGSGEIEDYQVVVEVAEPALEITKRSSQTVNSRVGDEITYTVTATNVGGDDYTEENPAIVLDDLSGVLDDADYNADGVADQGGEVSFEEPLLAWTGALPEGESVELTYSVTLKAGGDGNVRNVAFASDCDPAEEDCGTAPNCDVDDPACDSEEFDLPRLSIEKSADRTELPAIGESVEYTVTVTNEGPGDYTEDAPASFTDDLTDVLDAATFDDNVSASTGEVAYDEPTLSWEGALEAGESVTVTYSVTYTGEGDQTLLNLACVSEDEVLPGAEPCDPVRIPGADLEQWKQVESSDTPAEAGSVLTYTLFFKNDGEAAASVDSIDDLTHVLDDADMTVEPSSADGLTVTRDGERISITGSVPSGETYSVSYQVTVKADEDRGDSIVSNFLMENDPDIPPTTPPGPDCVPTEEQLPDCTTTGLPAISYNKSVEASETPVGAGTVLSYTVTVENTGSETGTVSREDVLTDVLDDAELTGAPASDTESVTVSDVVDGRFRIGGTLAAGETATVTYQVTVKDESERGNNSADNFLVVPGDTPPESCEPDSDQCTVTPLPQIVVDKAADPGSGSAVQAGQEVTFTLTFTNIGEAAGEADYTDDLAAVLDDAELTTAPAASDPALSVTDGSEGTVRAVGVLEPGQEVTVTYTATVKPDGERGDNELRNVVAKTGTDGPECGDDGVECTTHPIGELDDWKTVDPASGTTVREGAELTYTLHFENTGKADTEFSRDDVLTQVLDDSDVTSQPAASDGALTVTDIVDGRFQVSGVLAPGQAETVTYTVTVRPDGERGDDRLGNFLVGSGEEPPEKCAPADGQRPDCTVNHVSDVVVSKSSDPESGTEVSHGDEVTYTLTFENLSADPEAAPGDVDYTDYMADVLDDADLVSGPTASHESLKAVVEDDTIRITGAVPTGETSTVVYTIRVDETTDDGDRHLGNVVAITGEEPVCVPDSPLCTDHDITVSPEKPGLAVTGGEISRLVVGAGLVLLLIGGSLLVIRRRRRAAAGVDDQDVSIV